MRRRCPTIAVLILALTACEGPSTLADAEFVDRDGPVDGALVDATVVDLAPGDTTVADADADAMAAGHSDVGPDDLDGDLLPGDHGPGDAEPADMADRGHPIDASASDADRPSDAVLDAGPPRCPDPAAPLWRAPEAPIHPGIALDLTVDRAVRPAVEHRVWWTLVDAPQGSLTTIEEDADRAAIPLDLAGRYTLRVDMVAGDCPVVDQIYTVDVEAPSGLYVELIWDRLGDQNASPTDLDLLVRHTGLTDSWASGPGVCEAATPSPDWAEAEVDADDPRMPIRPLLGGPEAVHLALPEPGVRYAIALHTAALSSFQIEFGGHVTVVGRVYIDGRPSLRVERAARDEDQLQTIADVVWCAADDPACDPTPIEIRDRQNGR